MKFTTVWKSILLSVLFISLSSTLIATPPGNPPPRGRAYGFFLKDGGQVLFIYLEKDGSRLIELSNCRQNRSYLIRRSTDLTNWTTLAEVQIGADGTGSALDATSESHCFYNVAYSN